MKICVETGDADVAEVRITDGGLSVSVEHAVDCLADFSRATLVDAAGADDSSQIHDYNRSRVSYQVSIQIQAKASHLYPIFRAYAQQLMIFS